MLYYFNSYIQRQADAAYDNGHYEQALKYYESALDILNQRRSSREHIFEYSFNYAYAYVLSEIIYTRRVLISLALEDGQPVAESFSRMRGQYAELQLMLKNPLFPDNKTTMETRCNELKKNIGEIYEKLSDLSYDEFLKSKDSQTLLQAIAYMEDALNHYKPDVDIQHLYGYFNLLEQAFLKTKEQTCLQKIQEYLPPMNEMSHLSAEQKMEGYSYWYLIKTNSDAPKLDIEFIEQQINRCYEHLSEAEKNNEDLVKCWRQINRHHQAAEEETLEFHPEENCRSDLPSVTVVGTAETREEESEEDIPRKRKWTSNTTPEESLKKRDGLDNERRKRARTVTFFASTSISHEENEQQTLAMNAQKFLSFIHQIQKTSGPMDATFIANTLLVISEALTSLPQHLIPRKLPVPLVQYTLTLESMRFKETIKAKQELIKLELNRWVKENRRFVSHSLQEKEPSKEELIRCLDNFVNEITTYAKDAQLLNAFFHSLLSKITDIYEKHGLLGSHTAQYIDKLRTYINEQMIEPSESSVVTQPLYTSA